MSSWKQALQVCDLEPDQRLEITCKRCSHVHYITQGIIFSKGGRPTLYLDEIERKLRCKSRGCGGDVRLALVSRDATTGFVGGLA